MKSQTKTVNVVIFGIGAMASLLASFLLRLRTPKQEDAPVRISNLVMFGSWQEQLSVLQTNGLSMSCRDGSVVKLQPDVTCELSELPAADWVFVLGKSYQTERMASQVAEILRPNGLAVTLQNGLGNLELLQESLGQERAAQGVSSHGAYLRRPGHLVHAGEGETQIGLVPGREDDIHLVARALDWTGFATQVTANAESLVWGKCAINAAVNPLTALLEVKNGELLQEPMTCRLMALAVEEVASVAAALKIELPYGDPVGHVESVCRATADNRSSMLQDVLARRPGEVEAISGAVVAHGIRLGIETPVNDFLLRHVTLKMSGVKFDPAAFGELDIS